MIKGIIFDMDGVIIDSNRVHYENWNTVFKRRFGIVVPMEEFASRLGESSKDFTEYFIRKYNLKVNFNEIVKELRENFYNNSSKINLKKNVKEVLGRLKQNYKIALATGANKEWAIDIITSNGLSDYFDYVIAGNEVKKAKPEPEIFLKAAEMLKLKPRECVVIEDASFGILAAKNAGMFVISIPDDFTKYQDHSKADLHLKSISEISTKLLEGIGGKNG